MNDSEPPSTGTRDLTFKSIVRGTFNRFRVNAIYCLNANVSDYYIVFNKYFGEPAFQEEGSPRNHL